MTDMLDCLHLARTFCWHFCTHLMLVGQLAAMGAILIFRAGRALGVPQVFFHENVLKQVLNGFAVALLLGEILFVGFLLDNGELPVETYFATGAMVLVAAALVLTFVGFLVELVSSYDDGLRVAWQSPRRLLQHVRREGREVFGMTPSFRGDQGEVRSASVASWPLLLGLVVGAIGVLVELKVRTWLEGTAQAIAGSSIAVVLTLGQGSDDPPHILAGIFFVIFIVFYTAGWLVRPFRSFIATPAISFCVLLALLASMYGFVSYHHIPDVVWIGGLLLALAVGGAPKYKLKVPGLSQYDRARVSDYQPAGTGRAATALIKTEDIGSCWGDHEKRPIALVCASGGGLRAAVWTVAMLEQFELELEGFPRQTRLIAGASGGMVGAANWTASLEAPSQGGEPSRRAKTVLDELVRNTSKDCLSEVLKTLIFADLPGAFCPWRRHDRGQVLEKVFRENMSPAFGRTFAELCEGERLGWRPSLVFSPMLVEDGRRLLISNLDLDSLTTNQGVVANVPRPFSRSAYELARMFPDSWKDFPLSTAVRLSASFPYITPTAVLPTQPRRRVGDAGYYDNYGMNVLAGWLSDCVADEKKREWLRRSASGVAVIQIRDGVSELSRVTSPIGTGRSSLFGRAIEGLTGPPAAVVAARNSVPLFRNDEQLEGLLALYNETFGPGFLHSETFEFDGSASISWYLAEQEIGALTTQARCNEGDLRVAMDNLTEWWGARAPASMAKKTGSGP